MKTFKKLAALGLAGVVIITSAGCRNSDKPSTQPSGTESETTATETAIEEDDGISVGDHIMFGNYPQKDKSAPEPIEWRVLEIKDGKAFIITEYLLDQHVFNDELADVTWENSSLRNWLNGKFYDTAFSVNEKNIIQTVTIKNPDNPLYGTPGGNDTEDNVFCLSLEEVQIYFKDTDDRMSAPTDYAVSRHANVCEDKTLDNGMKTGWWWLRTPASSANRAADVDCYGNIDNVINADGVDGDYVFSEGNCVRPAVWILLSDDLVYRRYAALSPEEIVAELTMEQKAAQMVQPILYNSDVQGMQDFCYGSIYGDEGVHTAEEWSKIVDNYQKAAVESEAGIPFLLAQDDVHGVGYCVGAVYFPHNIGIGAANDEELAYKMGLITANEAKQCHMMWNLYPCVAQSADPRWGRTYECYSSDIETIKRLSTAYTRGLVDGGVIACSKHFFGDGNVLFGTGDHEEYSFLSLIDRGDAKLSEEEINELLSVYQAQIDAGVQTIMVSYSSLNGIKMHENGEYIWKLKNEMGFEGFVVSDSMAIQYTSPDTYEEQVITAINSGIDMLMEGEKYAQARTIIVDSVNSGKITEERVNDAVTRIIRVKKDAGLFYDPYCENITTGSEVGSADSRAVAEQLVEKSIVLLKNDNDTLPVKEGSKVLILGPAADNCAAQVGGWTLGWNKSPVADIEGVTTIKEAFMENADEYGIEVITDPDRFDEADVIILCVGEDSYAEWFGDSMDISLTGGNGLENNMRAINQAKSLGKPVVTCIVAGRHLFLGKSYYDTWDSVVMCYLPGSEGKGISDVLCGYADFTGRLPSPWYGSNKQIIGMEDCVFERGYGLSYGEDFVPRTESDQ